MPSSAYEGKLTTDPSKHTGEGIFFTSRVFDEFWILSGGLFLTHTYGKEDWLLEREQPRDGTTVLMKLSNHTSRTLQKKFDEFTGDGEDQGFNKTVVPLRLAQYAGTNKPASRSQAKRVLARRSILFKNVVLAFLIRSDDRSGFC